MSTVISRLLYFVVSLLEICLFVGLFLCVVHFTAELPVTELLYLLLSI